VDRSTPQLDAFCREGKFNLESALEGVGNDVPLFLVCGLDVL